VAYGARIPAGRTTPAWTVIAAADARLSQDDGHVRVRLHRPGDDLTAPGRTASHTYVLGDPLAYSVTLDVLEGARSNPLAIELIEAPEHPEEGAIGRVLRSVPGRGTPATGPASR
jgi:hypothetical protein